MRSRAGLHSNMPTSTKNNQQQEGVFCLKKRKRISTECVSPRFVFSLHIVLQSQLNNQESEITADIKATDFDTAVMKFKKSINILNDERFRVKVSIVKVREV